MALRTCKGIYADDTIYQKSVARVVARSTAFRNTVTMLELPVMDPDSPRPVPLARRPVRAVALHVVRIAMFVTTLLMIRIHHERQLAADAGDGEPIVSLDDVRKFFPDAATVSDPNATWTPHGVLNADGEPLGYVVQTSPTWDDIVGFSGPTNVMVAFDAEDRVVGAEILSSRDTQEHVDMILNDGRIPGAWQGLTWDELAVRLTSPEALPVDAVSGATLTSLAIVESVAREVSGATPPTSLRFPNEISLEELKELFPGVVTYDATNPLWVQVNGPNGPLGSLMRTSPAADNVIGYQGPTDTLVALDAGDRVIGMRIRSSFDNEPYVGYVRDEAYFMTLFNGRDPSSLAEMDLFEDQVEGVSGATMTSMAVAEGLIAVGKAASRDVEVPERVHFSPESSVRFTWRSLASVSLVVIAIGMGVWPRLFRRGLTRRVFQLAVIVLLGLVNGDLVSQAVLVGWARSGVPWRLAPGLVVLTAAALLVPMLSRQQPYCQHLCPHGLVQQLLIRRIGWQWKVPRRLHRLLSPIPLLLLLAVVVIAMTDASISLVDLEPFDAWVIGLAAVAAVTIAIVGLVASLFVPMAYCRYGCPTGTLLQFLRYHSRSDRLTLHDAAAATLTAVAIGFVVAGG